VPLPIRVRRLVVVAQAGAAAFTFLAFLLLPLLQRRLARATFTTSTSGHSRTQRQRGTRTGRGRTCELLADSLQRVPTLLCFLVLVRGGVVAQRARVVAPVTLNVALFWVDSAGHVLDMPVPILVVLHCVRQIGKRAHCSLGRGSGHLPHDPAPVFVLFTRLRVPLGPLQVRHHQHGGMVRLLVQRQGIVQLLHPAVRSARPLRRHHLTVGEPADAVLRGDPEVEKQRRLLLLEQLSRGELPGNGGAVLTVVAHDFLAAM